MLEASAETGVDVGEYLGEYLGQWQVGGGEDPARNLADLLGSWRHNVDRGCLWDRVTRDWVRGPALEAVLRAATPTASSPGGIAERLTVVAEIAVDLRTHHDRIRRVRRDQRP